MAFIDLNNPLYERRLELERKKKEEEKLRKSYADVKRENDYGYESQYPPTYEEAKKDSNYFVPDTSLMDNIYGKKFRSEIRAAEPTNPYGGEDYKYAGMEILPMEKDDGLLKTAGKGLLNYGVGSLLRALDAPKQVSMNIAKNIVNTRDGKELDIRPMSFTEDIMPQSWNQGLTDFQQKNPLLGGLARTGLEIVSDPGTFVGGLGVIDDLGRAGLVGKSAKRGTAENLEYNYNRGQRLYPKANTGSQVMDTILNDAANTARVGTAQELGQAKRYTLKSGNIDGLSQPKEVHQMSKQEFDVKYGLDKDLKGLKPNEVNQIIDDTTNRLMTDTGNRIISKVGSNNIQDAVKYYQDKYGIRKIVIQQVDKIGKKDGVLANWVVNKYNNKTGALDTVTIKIKRGLTPEQEFAAFRHELEHGLDKANKFDSKPSNKNITFKDTDTKTPRTIFEKMNEGHIKNYKWFEADYLRRGMVKDAILDGKQVPQEIIDELGLQNVKPTPKVTEQPKIETTTPTTSATSTTTETVKEVQQPTKTTSTEVKPVEQPKPKYTPEVQKALDDLDKEYATNYGNKLNRSLSEQKAAKRREIIQGDKLIAVDGGLTDIELSNKIKRLKTNHKGKEVMTPDGEAILTGKSSYGKVGAKLQDGTVKYYPSDQIIPKNDVDEIIARQKSEQTALQTTKQEPTKTVQKVTEQPKQPTKTVEKATEPTKTVEPTKQVEPVKEVETKQDTKTEQSSKTEQSKKKLKVSKFYNTVKEADTTNKQYAESLTKEIPPEYEKVVNQETWDRAIERVSKNEQAEYNRIISKETFDSADDTATAMALIKKYSNEGKWEESTDLLMHTSKILSKEGQVIQAASIWARQTPEGMLKHASNITRKTYEKSGGMKLDELRDTIKSLETKLKDKNVKLNLELYRETEVKLKAAKTELGKLQKRIDKDGLSGKLSQKDADYIYKNMQEHTSKDFYDQVYNEKLQQLMKKNNVSSPTDAMKEAAKLYAQGKQDTALSRVMTKLADLEPTTARDKLRTLQRISMLLNGRTVITNNLGNALMSTVDIGIRENTVGAFVDYLGAVKRTKSLVKPITNPLESGRTTLFTPITKGVAYAKGFGKGTADIFKDLGNSGIKNLKALPDNASMKDKLSALFKDINESVDTNPSRGQFETPNKTIFRQKEINPNSNKFVQFGTKRMNNVRAFGNFLDQLTRKVVTDRPFFEAAEQARKAELKKINKGAELTPEQLNEARRYALDKVFQNDSVLSESLVKIRDMAGVFGDLAMPFVKTPGNIADKILDYSPAGMGKILHQLGTRNKGQFDTKLFVDRLSRTITGTGALFLGYKLAESKLITGGNESKSEKRNEFNKALGRQNYSILFNGKYYPYAKLQPIGTLLAIGADIYQSGADKKTMVDSLESGAEGGINTFFSQSVMQNISNLFSGFSPAVSLLSTAAQSTTQAEPTLLKQIAEYNDPYMRETKGDTIMETTQNRLKQGIPRLRQTLESKVDVFGENVKNPAYNDVFNAFINPIRGTSKNTNKIKDELSRLYDYNKDIKDNLEKGKKSTNPTDVLPSVLGNKITTGSSIIELTKQETTKYKRLYGTEVMKNLNELILSSDYNDSTDDEKTKLIRDELEISLENAKVSMLEELGYEPEVREGFTKYKKITID